MAKEIERKFILKHDAFDRLILGVSGCTIRQGYLSEESPLHPVVRVRLKEEHGMQMGFITIKHKGGKVLLGVNEYEYMIPADDAIEMLDEACSNTIQKIRYEVEIDSVLWELDLFLYRHLGIRVAEVEFSSEEDAIAFNVPDFVACEVTNDPRFSNKYLSNAIPENIAEVKCYVYSKEY